MKPEDVTAARADFSRLYAQSSLAVLGYLFRRTRSAEEAADLTAEVFEIVWRRWKDVPEGEEARLWLYGVARRAMANHRRTAARQSEAVRRLALELERVAQPTTTLELDDLLQQLKPVDRDIITMVFWEGLTLAEVAVVLGMPAASVRTRFRRARQSLEQALERLERRADGITTGEASPVSVPLRASIRVVR